jgi:membrane-associated phospholipid phosphatase
MTPRREPFLAWPSRDCLGYSLRLAAVLAAWWVVVYHGADYWTGLRAHRVRVHLDAELAMPFVPAFILAYLSLHLVFVLAPFVLRTRRRLQALVLTLAAVTGVAGLGFLLIPAEPAYSLADAGAWSGLFEVSRMLALRYNMVPSLHVALSGVCLAAYASQRGRVVRSFLGVWLAAIALSTLLTHQHHLIDVITGLILAWAGKVLIYDRWRTRSTEDGTVPASPSGGPGPSA